MLLDYHSLYSEPEPTPQPAPAWVPQPRKERKRQRQVVALGVDATLPQVEAHSVARVRTRASSRSALLMSVFSAVLDQDEFNGGWTDAMLLLAAALLLDDEDEDDYDD